ncbi:uncharacterized protein LOC110093661 [Dendrobium catenatum]|nr:uncharacterized protein LOC110093661 [Dendrobium catenatum]
MRATKMGLLCRSQAATAVCVPGDARAMVRPMRPDRPISDHANLLEPKYARLTDHRRRLTAAAAAAERHRRRRQAVTLPMVTKREKDPPKPKPKPEARPPVPNSYVSPINQNELFQVVVMRVSIHCQGCAGKVRKHISKMEGVTSFSIDLETKRVTVMGHISPVGVLESISKVKKAEFWSC